MCNCTTDPLKTMHDTSSKNAGTRHAIALKPRENYCNLELLHNRNQPFLRVYRNFISLHLNYVVQWLCKSMLNCSPMIDYQLVKWYILLSDAGNRETLYLIINQYFNILTFSLLSPTVPDFFERCLSLKKVDSLTARNNVYLSNRTEGSVL